jgi:N6-adenosine-specific RNA methylase IME4/ParB-like chromosome segregation protein Spo0J
VRQAQIDDISIGKRHRRDLGDIDELAASIKSEGLLQPIAITPDNELIAGRRRLEAHKRLGRDEIPVHVVDLEAIVRGEQAENVHRKAFTPSETVAIHDAVLDIEKRQAKERMSEGGKVGKISTPSGKARDKAATGLGMSGRTIEKAREIVEAAEAAPDRYGKLLDDMDRTGRVNGPHKRLVVARKAEAIAKEPPPLPAGPFRVIIADPPWPYELRSEDPSQRGTTPYPQMSIEQIKAMPVADIAHDDAILWLWSTNLHMPHAFEVAAAWGFEHKTILTWAKSKMGCGDWLRGQTEHCLFATRGKPTVTLSNETTLLPGPVREHSRKPEEFYALVKRLCPGATAELFQRTEREGIVGHGDEVPISQQAA